MLFTVFVYRGNKLESEKGFSTIKEAFSYLGELDLGTDVERCILDNGRENLFDLTRNQQGYLSRTP